MAVPLRHITAEEFARRLRASSRQQDKRYAFFLGAGCSVSSGIPDSGTLVRENWLPRLRAVRAPHREDVDGWAAQEFDGYDPERPALIYGDLVGKLFFYPEERQREIEELCERCDPGFGYATLAQMMTIEGGRFNIVLTTNFDDLIQDALYVYTKARPLVIQHESLAGYIRPTRTRPLVVKLHGDNHLTPYNTSEETERLKDEIQSQIKTILYDRGLIFIGYGGNDKSIKSLLEALPPEALPLGVYWVSGREPQGEIRSWLESRKAILVDIGDFDLLMVLIMKEFALPHPDERRFNDVFANYNRTLAQLSTKISSMADSEPDAVALKMVLDSWNEDDYKKKLDDLSAL
jgi:hypothetical protein